MTKDNQSDAAIPGRIKTSIDGGVDHALVEPPLHPALLASPAHHLAHLAHELKTPLSAIVAAAEVMRDERLGPIGNSLYQGYAADIFESAHHALGVIAGMLTPAARESDAGRDALAFVELDANDLVRKLASSVRALLGAAGLEIDLRLEPALPHLIADPVTVRQMLLNLVTNAMRATPAGGRIEITTAYVLAGPVSIAVADTGRGMSSEEVAGALDPTRHALQTSSPSAGSGIGYPLTLRLAALNGASVAIESSPGAGTTATIAFSAARVVPV